MEKFRLTVKNYRCFSDENPLSFNLSRQYTALIGQNNSGKSALLRMIYELKELWNNIASPDQFKHFFNPNFRTGISYRNVPDYTEIFNNDNNREITIEITDVMPVENGISTVACTCHQDTNQWVFSVLDRNKGQISNTIQATKIDYGDFQIDGHGIARCGAIIRFSEILANSLYIGPFRNAINVGSGTYYDLNVGTDFVKTWNA